LRDELINLILDEKRLNLIAVAGTHGKTTTTAMLIWLFKQFNVPISYSVGAKIPFGAMGQYMPGSEYFIYEADEFARNFLSFQPAVSLVTGVDWDHPDIYPTRDSYNTAFEEFLAGSERIVMWQEDAELLRIVANPHRLILESDEPAIDRFVQLPGKVNRMDAWEAVQTTVFALGVSVDQAIQHINAFPGVSRRFEQITPKLPKLYSDYAHTPPKVRGALQIAQEVGGQNVAVVYEGLHNTRQHFIKEDLEHLFDDVKQLYIVPSYLAREDPDLELLTPEKLRSLLSDKAKAKAHPAALDAKLQKHIQQHLDAGDLVLCLSAGGGGSLDEWLRTTFKPQEPQIITV
jgi:UDP-N-acetylmuramate--alanine ligase